ncbi:MAG: AAA family ATPase [Luteitalea sp.]|nr:AAA family ATPase [Luteitalea sp.]
MYRDFFGLSERPFDLTTNPRFLFLSSGHREALSVLHYGMAGDKGITVLVGEAGTGKTTLARAALAHYQSSEVLGLYLNNPTLTRQEFFEFVAHGVGLSPKVARSKATFLRELDALLGERRRSGKLTALIVDEAQAIPTEILEEIRMLANLESPTSKHLSILLAGQPELATRLNEPALLPLKQRVALRTTLTPFRLLETACYLAMRIRVAGGDPAAIFYRSAVERIHQVSRGVPRTINVVSDNALLTAFALKAKPVSTDIIAEVCRDLDVNMGGNEPVVAEAQAGSSQEPGAVPGGERRQLAPDRGPGDLLGTPRPPAAVHRPEGNDDHARKEPSASRSNETAMARRAVILSVD